MSNHAFSCLLAKVMIVASDAGFSYFRLETHHNVSGIIMFVETCFTQVNIYIYILCLVKGDDDCNKTKIL